jgi:hypothetical protein
MRTTFFLLAIVLLGILLGVGVAVWQIGTASWKPAFDADEEGKTAMERSHAPTPRLEIQESRYDFGSLDIASSGSHDFVLANGGDGPLKLMAGPTSCRCATSKLERKDVPPGGSTKVTVTWKSTEKIGHYEQTAQIVTNDPDRPTVTLTVAGRITAMAHVTPSELTFSQIAATETATAQTRLLSFLERPLRVLGREWSDPTTAKYFDVSVEPLPKEDLQEWAAKSGALATVTVKPGMPSGPFRQTLTLRTNLEQMPRLTLSIQGTVASEIAVVGPGWDADTETLTLGVISRGVGLKHRLLLVVRGAARREVTFRVSRVAPEFLKVGFGPRGEINDGKVVETPLLIEIPPGSPMVNRLGSEEQGLGEILLETTHPQVRSLRILVQMAIKE